MGVTLAGFAPSSKGCDMQRPLPSAVLQGAPGRGWERSRAPLGSAPMTLPCGSGSTGGPVSVPGERGTRVENIKVRLSPGGEMMMPAGRGELTPRSPGQAMPKGPVELFTAHRRAEGIPGQQGFPPSPRLGSCTLPSPMPPTHGDPRAGHHPDGQLQSTPPWSDPWATCWVRAHHANILHQLPSPDRASPFLGPQGHPDWTRGAKQDLLGVEPGPRTAAGQRVAQLEPPTPTPELGSPFSDISPLVT